MSIGRDYNISCGCYQKWIDTSHYETFYYGGGYRFENTSTGSKDLETLAALKEEAAVAFLTEKFKSDFSLSDNRAQELAKLATKYQRMESVRELTQAEKDHFALKALGVSMNQIESAVKNKSQGSETEYAELLKKAALVNNTTPEQIGKFFTEVVEEI
jgi:hypothetical protein